jgi:superfamily II DNA or RNA helicase
MDLDSVANWTEPKPITTARGGTLIRTARPSPGFWSLWARYKTYLRKHGISPRKLPDGTWEITHFMDGQLHELALEDSKIDSSGLLKWQVEPMTRLVEILKTNLSAVDSSSTGVGKTYTACSVAKNLGLALGVICPKAVIPSWHDASKHIGTEIKFVVNYEGLKFTAGEKYIVWTPMGYPVWKISERDPVLLVFDEAHRCKDHNLSKNALMLISAVSQKIRHLLVSATLADSPLHMRAVGYSLGLHNGRNFQEWIRSLGCWKDSNNRWHFTGGENSMKRIRSSIFPARGVRIRADDLGKDFPTTLITAEVIEASGADKIYESLQKRLEKVQEQTENYHKTVLTEVLGARRRVELLKVPSMVSLAKDAIEQDNSVAIFVCFNETVEALKEALKCPTITGDTPQNERNRIMKVFRADRIPAVVLNISAGGVGISLHGARQRLSLISPSWSAIDLIQTIGRVRRAGGSHSVQKILFANGSVEESVCARVRSKVGCIETLNDGDTQGITMKRKAEPKHESNGGNEIQAGRSIQRPKKTRLDSSGTGKKVGGKPTHDRTRPEPSEQTLAF